MLALAGNTAIVEIADCGDIGGEHEIEFAAFGELRTFDVVASAEPAVGRCLRQTPRSVVISDASNGESELHRRGLGIPVS